MSERRNRTTGWEDVIGPLTVVYIILGIIGIGFWAVNVR